MTKQTKIVWTKVDEAPALSSYALLPIVKGFLNAANIQIEERNISLAGRILATFPEYLSENQRINDDLAYLGELVKKPEAAIIKLPNISASVPQLKAAIKELQEKGFNVPDYPENPQNEEEQKIKDRYAKVLGSAANPVLRQGNSDRRVAPSVKKYAQQHPHKLKDWDKDSKTHVAHMEEGDFYENEKSIVIKDNTDVRYELITESGETIVLKEHLPLEKDEVLDGTFLSAKKLREYIGQQIQDAKEKNVLFSIHLKATMMKVSDPVIFGHFVSVYFKEVFEKYADTFNKIGVNPDLGLVDLYQKIQSLPEQERTAIEKDIQSVYEKNPDLAMVDSDKGITNLHAPNLVIIDASMPPLIREGGKMWGPDGKLHQVKANIPDRSYATMYKEAVEYCKEHGAFNPATMGNVANVGLMAMKAEEYGSHDKTFKIPENGTVKVIDNNTGETLMSHKVEKGDIYRGCQAKDIAIKDWVKLAVRRAKETGNPAVFWLDENRAHDTVIIEKVKKYLQDYDTTGLEIHIMSPQKAMRYTLDRVKAGKDTISVTGNVLRDYLTDLFPILEIGTSARMLSIVPLLAGGGLYETGAGGSAPKHVQQFLEEGHLRWDSLGEYLALTVTLEDIGKKYNNQKASILSEALDKAVEKLLNNSRLPSRKVNEPDNRNEHFYLSLYWAEELASQNKDEELKKAFAHIAEELKNNEEKINNELLQSQGYPQDIGGYYLPDEEKANKAMRPSDTYNSIISKLSNVAVNS